MKNILHRKLMVVNYSEESKKLILKDIANDIKEEFCPGDEIEICLNSNSSFRVTYDEFNSEMRERKEKTKDNKEKITKELSGYIIDNRREFYDLDEVFSIVKL